MNKPPPWIWTTRRTAHDYYEDDQRHPEYATGTLLDYGEGLLGSDARRIYFKVCSWMGLLGIFTSKEAIKCR